MTGSRLSSLCVLGFVAISPAIAEPVPAPGRRDLATEVKAVFQAKCTQCHGPKVRKPKGDFGYVLDLKKLAADSDKVVPGKPEDSQLWQLVDDDEMPAEGAKAGPLTKKQKQIIYDWIAAGAPSTPVKPNTPSPSKPKKPSTTSPSKPSESSTLPPPKPSESSTLPPPKPSESSTLSLPNSRESSTSSLPKPEMSATSPTDEEVESVPPPNTTKRLIRFLGKFHVIVIHFPIALLLSAVVGEGVSVWQRVRQPSFAVHFCVLLGAISAVVAAVLGWFHAASGYGLSAPSILTCHRRAGTVTAGVATFLAAFSIFENHRGVRTVWFRVLLLLTALLVSAAGYFGGLLAYGDDFFEW